MSVEFVRVADRRSIAPGHAANVSIGRYDVAIFHTDGRFFAYENSCPHQGAPIVDGLLEGPTLTCAWHAWCFDLRTGKLAIGDYAELRRFEIRVEGDAIFVATEPSFDFAQDDISFDLAQDDISFDGACPERSRRAQDDK
jgi:nitrite reductase (NADH) small subunit